MKKQIHTQNCTISENSPVYIIAEIGSNFDGSLEKAKSMVDLAVEVGANCAKFQSFLPDKIISNTGFSSKRGSFQAQWKQSVYEVYRNAVFPREWHKKIQAYCKKKRIDFASSPYDTEAVNLLNKLGVDFFKIGSGEVANLDFIEFVAHKRKPLLIAVGASTLGEIDDMMTVIKESGNPPVVLMQCVTNYPSPFEDANLRVLDTLKLAFGTLVGYSDHTPGFTVPLGAVALGAKVIEKHFTDNKKNAGPDHPFALDPREFRAMVDEIRNLEKAMGNSIKVIYPSEQETKIIQRRSLYSATAIKKGEKIQRAMITSLRPAKGVAPKFKPIFIGKIAQKSLPADTSIDWDLITTE